MDHRYFHPERKTGSCFSFKFKFDTDVWRNYSTHYTLSSLEYFSFPFSCNIFLNPIIGCSSLHIYRLEIITKLPRGLFRQLSSLFLIWSELHEEFPPLNTPKHNHQVEGNWEIKPNTFTPLAVSHQPNHNNIICINGQCSFLSHSRHTNRCLFYHSHVHPFFSSVVAIISVGQCLLLSTDFGDFGTKSF